MKSKILLTVASALLAVSPVFAGTITFDGAPVGGDLGNFYSGVTFGAGSQATFQTLPFAPAHSGNEFLASPATPNISFTFATPQTQLSFWYTTQLGFTVTAYDSSMTVVGTPQTVPANTGSDTFLNYSTGVANISSVVISDTFGLADFDAIDDLSAPGISGQPAPDATSTLALFGIAAAGLLAFRKKIAA